MLEMGKGYLFEVHQRRFTLNEDNYYVNLGFYNRFFRCYALIDLKVDNFDKDCYNKINMYVDLTNRV